MLFDTEGLDRDNACAPRSEVLIYEGVFGCKGKSRKVDVRRASGDRVVGRSDKGIGLTEESCNDLLFDLLQVSACTQEKEKKNSPLTPRCARVPRQHRAFS